jgi:chemotaxis protein MotB
VKARLHFRRDSPSHADDWLMTYADMITLLLCFFAIFLSISIAKRDAPKPVEVVRVVSLPVQPPDFLEGNLPFHGVERATHATEDLPAPPPPRPAEPPAPKELPPVQAAPAPVQAALAPAPAAAPAEAMPDPQPKAPPQIADQPQPHGPAATPPKGDRITILEVSSAAFFASGSATLSAEGADILRDVAQKLKSDEFRDYAITVEGHTDNIPIHTAQFPSNWELSTARAAAVLHCLLDQGIPAQKLRAAGYADTFPKAPNQDANGNPIPENEALNRRVVIKLEKIDRTF